MSGRAAVEINVRRIIGEMGVKGLKVRDVCALCGVNNKTVAKILRGEMPRRLDAFYRVVNGLGIPFQEAVGASTHKTTQGSGLRLVSHRRRSD